MWSCSRRLSSTASSSVGIFSPTNCPLQDNKKNNNNDGLDSKEFFNLQPPPDPLHHHLSLCLAAASSCSSWVRVRVLRGPEPLVVRSTVSSCIRTGTPSAENSRSSSTPVAPFFPACTHKTEQQQSLKPLPLQLGGRRCVFFHQSAFGPLTKSSTTGEIRSSARNAAQRHDVPQGKDAMLTHAPPPLQAERSRFQHRSLAVLFDAFGVSESVSQ